MGEAQARRGPGLSRGDVAVLGAREDVQGELEAAAAEPSADALLKGPL